MKSFSRLAVLSSALCVGIGLLAWNAKPAHADDNNDYNPCAGAQPPTCNPVTNCVSKLDPVDDPYTDVCCSANCYQAEIDIQNYSCSYAPAQGAPAGTNCGLITPIVPVRTGIEWQFLANGCCIWQIKAPAPTPTEKKLLAQVVSLPGASG